ncbi:MAG: hypothetical protein ACK41D_05160 [Rubricoccaceae bacterium]
MRLFALTLLLAAGLLVAAPAHAQLRAEAPGRAAPVAVYGGAGSQAVPSLGSMFNAQTLRFGQSYEASYSTGAAGSLGLGVYTSSLRWQPSERLAGRVDVGVAHSLGGSQHLQAALGFDENPARVFLRNAEIAYRPTANSVLHLQFQQSPYGTYAQPYGAYAQPYGAYAPYGPLGYRQGVSARFAPADAEALFWRAPSRP